MTLSAKDELRHTQNANPLWRESLYWNFNDPVQQIGAWIYLWVVPGNALPTGMIVSFYHGGWPDPAIYSKAMAAPGHLLQDRGNWIYCYQQNSAQPFSSDFDDVAFQGLRLRRLDPMTRYTLEFNDDQDNGFKFESHFMMPPFDYSEGANPVPNWLSTNRYHRNHRIRGVLRIGGQRLHIDCTGDSDHSWGARDWSIMGTNLFKMWSFQTASGELAVSLMNQGTDQGNVALGHILMDGKIASAKSIQSNARYDVNGVQCRTEMIVVDDLGRSLAAASDAMHSYVGWRVGSQGEFWGYEGVGMFDVEGFGTVPGATSFFWPSRISPQALHAGHVE
jgi:hypothetical protein